LSRNICRCPNPPGGQADCNEDQLALCRVVNGEAHTQCIDVPDAVGFLSSTEGKNWLLSEILQIERDPNQPVSRFEDSLLSSGVFRVPGTDDVVHFRIPVSSRGSRPLAV
jgi:hypothetical protein